MSLLGTSAFGILRQSATNIGFKAIKDSAKAGFGGGGLSAGVSAGIGSLSDSISSGVGSLGNSISSSISSVGSTFNNLGNQISSGVDSIGNVASNLGSEVSGVANSVTSSIKEGIGGASRLVDDAVAGGRDLVSSATKEVQSFFDDDEDEQQKEEQPASANKPAEPETTEQTTNDPEKAQTLDDKAEGEKAAEQVATELRKINIEQNILNEFEQYSYFIRFFMTGETSTFDTVAADDAIVIAETGSTGININDVTIITIPGPSSTTRNTISTEITFKLIEPLGSSLFDRIRNAAYELGVKDHRNCPYWIEVGFRGYTAAEENSTGGGEFANQFLSKLTKRWKITITDFEAEVYHGATEYTVKSVPTSEMGFRDSERLLERDIKVSGKTIQAFLLDLTTQLNKNESSSTGGDKDEYIRTKKYGFELPTKAFSNITNWELRADNITELKRSENIDVSETGGSWEFNFTKGTSIEHIIEIMFSVTNEGQSLTRFGEIKNMSSLQFNEARKINKPIITFMIESKTDIISYNQIANKYNLLHTYVIKPYKTNDAIGSREEIFQVKFENNNSKKRLLSVLSNGGFKKRYEYIYTGMNTEIIDYRIAFDKAWFVSLPLFQGQNRPSVSASSGNMDSQLRTALRIVQETGKTPEGAAVDIEKAIKTDEENVKKLKEKSDISEQDKIDIKLLEDRIVNAKKNLEILNTGTIRERVNGMASVDISPKDLSTAKWGANGRLSVLRDIASIQNPANANDKGNVNNNIQNNQNVNDQVTFIGAADDRQKILERNRNRAATSVGKVGSIFYVEDFGDLSVDQEPKDDKDPNSMIILPPNELNPVATDPDNSAEGAATKGRAYFSAITNQMYGSLGQMVELDMTIRGDPYWLGEPSVENRTLFKKVEGDLSNTDSLILLTFAFPNSYDDGGPEGNQDSSAGTGFIQVNRKENGFNGVYYIRLVESHFSNGLFTQKLTGHIDPLTQESDILEFINFLETGSGIFSDLEKQHSSTESEYPSDSPSALAGNSARSGNIPNNPGSPTMPVFRDDGFNGLSGSAQNAQTATKYFDSTGWSPHASSAVVANLMHESGTKLNPNAVGDSGSAFGIAQWRKDRRANLEAYAASKGKPVNDFQTQLEFVNKEVNSDYTKMKTKMNNAATPEEAAYIFAKVYERPKTVDGQRSKTARRIYNERT